MKVINFLAHMFLPQILISFNCHNIDSLHVFFFNGKSGSLSFQNARPSFAAHDIHANLKFAVWLIIFLYRALYVIMCLSYQNGNVQQEIDVGN